MRFLLVLFALLFASPALAQTNVLLNYQGANNNPVQASAANPLPVTVGGSSGGNINTLPAVNQTPTDCSSTITSGGAAQNAFAASTTVHGFVIQNLSADPMWISFTGVAVVGAQASYLLPAGSTTSQGGSYYSRDGWNTALSVIAATTGDKFSCTKW